MQAVYFSHLPFLIGQKSGFVIFKVFFNRQRKILKTEIFDICSFTVADGKEIFGLQNVHKNGKACNITEVQSAFVHFPALVLSDGMLFPYLHKALNVVRHLSDIQKWTKSSKFET